MSCQQKPKRKESSFELDLTFLEYLKKVMQPHQKEFNIVDLFQIILEYCIKQSHRNIQSSVSRSLHQSQSHSQSIPQNQSNNLLLTQPNYENPKIYKKNNSTQIQLDIQQKRLQDAQRIIDKLKQVFLWYKKQTLTFQMINNYVLSCQNHVLKDKNSLDNLSQYQNLPQRRIRLDENVKLCIMPQGDSSKIKFISTNPLQNDNEDIFRKQVFVVTSQYVRSIKIDSQKLTKQGNKTVKIHQVENELKNKISLVKNWYTYSQQKIVPESVDTNSKDMKISAKRQLYIEKVTMSQNIIGIITHERDIFIKPLLKQHQKHQRGRTVIPYQMKLGNMVSDIPDENLQRPLKKDKSKALEIERSKILLFECYNDDVWIAVNQLFVYVYILPLQNNKQYVNDELQKSSMLSLCEPFPAKAQQAKILTKEYMAVMTEDCCILILKLQLSSKKQERQKNKIYPTNKVYNDIKFICMDYHPVERQLVFTDFGSYLIRLKFNIANGDIQREGSVYNQKTGKFLTQNTTNSRRDKQFGAFKLQTQINLQGSLNILNSQLKTHFHQSRNQIDTHGSKTNKETLTIWQNKGKSINNVYSSQIHINNFKEDKVTQNKDKSGKSIYAKPQNTDFIKIVKNSSRQNMILLCLNKNNTTLITYEQTSTNPLNNGKSDSNQQADIDRLYDKTIKLWDLHYMNVYQTFTLSLQISQLSLQSNGLCIVTKDRGYLGFYPLLNKQQQQKQNVTNPCIIEQKSQTTKIGPKIVISGNQLFFYTQLPKEKNKNKVQESGYENHLLNYNNSVTTLYNLSFSKQQKNIQNLQEIPCQIAQMDVQNKIYILSDTSGDKKYNVNVYDMFGNKEVIMKGNKKTQKYGILENYTNVAKINHFQFNVLLWNKRSIKFIGSNMEQSFTVHWTFSCNQKGNSIQGSQFDMRSLKSSSRKQKSIEQIVVNQNSITILQKHQNQLFRNITLTIFSLQSARIKYRIYDIKSSFKVLSNFNSMLLAHQSYYKQKIGFQDSFFTERKSVARSIKSSIMTQEETTYPTQENEEYINMFDLNSPLNRKCIFTLKFKSIIEKNMTLNEIKQFQTGFNNLVFQDRYFVQNILSIKSAKIFSLNKDDSIIICCVFHLKTRYVLKSSQSSVSINKNKVLKSQDKYILYSRQISSQVAQKLNYIPRTIDTNVKKKSRKVAFQYVGQSDVHDRILGHWEIDLNQLLTRSTIKNFNYFNDFHSTSDHEFPPIIHDITQKIIKFSQNQQKYQNLLEKTQKIITIYQKSSNPQRNIKQSIKVEWILAEAESYKSVLCLSSQSFFQIYSQCLSFDTKKKDKLNVSLQKICKVVIDPVIDKPVVLQYAQTFNSQNIKIWQETKLEMIEYMRKKMSKQFTKQLSKKKSSIKEEQKIEQPVQNIDKNVFVTVQTPQFRKKAVSESKCYKNEFNSNQINNIFRQWTISKNIEKQLKNYQKNHTQAQQILSKELKIVIENPQVKQERIQYLLEFPQKIKDPTSPVKIKLLTKGNQLTEDIIDVKSILNCDQKYIIKEQRNTNEQKTNQQTPKIIKSQRQNLEHLQNRLQNLQQSIFLPKKLQSTASKSIKSSGTIKVSELKLTQNKTKTKSSLQISNQTKHFQHQGSKYLNFSQSKSCFQSPLPRVKTQTIDKNYLQLITQTPLQSLKSMYQNPTNQKFHKKIHSPNPQSSLSNVIINRSQSHHQNKQKIDFTKSSFKKPQISQFDRMPAKKNKSLMTRCKTQASNDDETLTNLSKSALIQLKQSAKRINQTVLPQIKINREKLNEKMKEKKSFLKSINQRLGSFRQQIKSQVLKKQLNESLIKLSPIQ